MSARVRVALVVILLAICHELDTAKSTTKQSKSSCNISILDDCAATVFVFGKRSVYLPKNESEMVPHCQEEFDAETCIKSYARRCLDPFSRQVVGILLHGSSHVIHSRCKPKGVKEYLSHKECIGRTIGELHDCMDQLVLALNAITTSPADEKIRLACCSFARYQHCSVQPIKRKCKDPKAVDYINVKMIKGYASEVLDIACSGMSDWESERCSSLNVPDGGLEYREGRIITTARANVTLKKKTASLLPPFINIFTKL